MINILETKKNKVIFAIITAILIISMVTVSGNFNSSQSSNAQKTNGTSIGTFSVSGYTGQSFILPPSITQIPPFGTSSQFNLLPPTGSIIAGNWSFVVNDGKLKDFKWDVNHLTLNGKVNGTFSITEISNSTGAVLPTTTNKNIQLSENSNSTIFKANANININGRTVFNDVPIVLSLSNGKLVNLSIDPAKTDGLFITPIFGIATSLTR